MKALLFIVVAALLVSCNNNADTRQIQNDTVLEAGGEREELAIIQNAFPQLFSYLKKEDATFDAAHFYEAEVSKMSPAPAQPLHEESLQPYKDLFVYNTDRSKAIDQYSYNYVITADSIERMQNAGPDTEIALVDFKNKTRKRIFFSGPSFAIWDAAWLPHEGAVLAGAEVVGEQKIVPLFLQVNFTDSSIKTFQSSDTLQADMKEYVAQKIKRRL